MIPNTVVAWNKNHGLLGTDMLKVDTSKLINYITDENNRIVKRLYGKHTFKGKPLPKL